jgi:hypothetical protein
MAVVVVDTNNEALEWEGLVIGEARRHRDIHKAVILVIITKGTQHRAQEEQLDILVDTEVQTEDLAS